MSQVELAGPLIEAPALDLSSAAGLVREAGIRRVWSLRITMAAAFAVTAFAAVAVGAWWWSGTVVPWDSKNHFYAMFRFLAEALSRGEIPLWNPYHFGGHPTVADPQSLLFTPTMVLFALLAPQASMQVFDAMIFSHLLLGGLGMLMLFRRRDWNPAGAVLAAIIFMLGGSAASRLQHTGMIISYGFLPLALWTLEEALERVSLRWGVAFAVLAAAMALGRDQVAYLSCMVLIGAVAWHTMSAATPLRYLVRSLPVLTVAAIVGAALMVVPVLLTIQFLSGSNRPGIAYGVAVAGSLAPVNFITMLAPNVFGSLDWNYDYWGPGYETMADPDWTDRAVNYLFAGTLPILLLFWHGLAGGRLLGRGLRFFAIVGVLAVVYAVGRATPMFGWVFDSLPGVSLYRRPADATFILNFAVAMAAGYLLDRYVTEGLPQPFRRFPLWLAGTLTAIAVGLAAFLVGSALAFSAVNLHLGPALLALTVALGIAAFLVAALAWGTTPQRRIVAALGLVAFTAGELVWHNASASINAEPTARYSIYDAKSASDLKGLAVLKAELAAKAQQGEHPRVEILGLGGAWQNASMVEGLENTLGYNPLRIADYERAVGPGENAVDPNLRHYPGTFRGYRCTLASLLGLQYLVLDRPFSRMPRHVPRPAATEIYAGDHMYIYRLGPVAPRAYFASQVKATEVTEILDEHSLPMFDRSTTALIENTDGGELAARYPEGLGGGESHVSVAAHHDNRVVLSVDTDRAGIVVLHDLYYPGWVAKVDGETRPMLRANVLFRGVEVPAGHHVVAFEFHPFALANLAAAASEVLHLGDE